MENLTKRIRVRARGRARAIRVIREGIIIIITTTTPHMALQQVRNKKCPEKRKARVKTFPGRRIPSMIRSTKLFSHTSKFPVCQQVNPQQPPHQYLQFRYFQPDLQHWRKTENRPQRQQTNQPFPGQLLLSHHLVQRLLQNPLWPRRLLHQLNQHCLSCQRLIQSHQHSHHQFRQSHRSLPLPVPDSMLMNLSERQTLATISLTANTMLPKI
mmetsp:Transcript_34311/g.80864  ORF Transcript_34311/g.80864 Transcript_34311/m.80864 type:complete len:212 (+) Transcript_34311:596-1231(+)